MADNITLNAGTGGDTLAADDVAGVKHQRVKPVFGADGSATDVSATTPLPVAQQAVIGQLTIAAGSGTRTSSSVDLAGFQYLTGGWASSGGGGSAMTLQFSNDGTTWTTPSGASLDYLTTGGGWVTSNISSVPVSMLSFISTMYGRYVRLSTGSTTTGTYTLQVTGSNAAPPPGGGVNKLFVKGAGFNPTDSMTFGDTLSVVNAASAYIGGASALFTRVRTPNIYKVASFGTAGTNTVWTPTSGMKFRLMRYKINISNGATGSDTAMTFYDGGVAMPIIELCNLPSTAGSTVGAWSTGWCNLENGILSSTANNVLGLNVNIALTNGNQVRCMVAGIEE